MTAHATQSQFLPLQRVAARGRLEGLLFELSVEQTYRNASDRVIEAVFTFPVPVRAVLLGLELQLGERRLEAVAIERQQATEKYERAIDTGDAAVLLESVGNGLYTVSVGNLKPGEIALIRYRHAELLDANRGLLRLQVPTVIAPRYGDPAEDGLEGPAIPEAGLLVEYPFDIEIDLVGALDVAGLQSPTHLIRIEHTESGTTVRLAKAAQLDRDFVLEVPRANVPQEALVVRDGDEWVVVASAVLENAEPESRALALTVVLDCSGSMNGDSIDAARRAVGRVLENLTPEDRFGLLRFGSTTQWVTQGLETCRAERLELLRTTVRGIEADLGGTEMSRALTEALGTPVPPGQVADLLLVTDGEVHELERLVQLVARAGRRLFVVAVGAAPNEALARRLSETTGGACEFVASGELAEEAIVRMFRRLRAEPRAVRGIEWPGTVAWELPAPTSVFPDETVHLLAGFRAKPTGLVRIRMGTAAAKVDVLDLRVSEKESESAALVRVAAARRLALLTPTEATALATRHQIASAFTSFVVVAERSADEKAKGLPATVPVNQMLAAGWGGSGRILPALVAEHAMRPLARAVEDPMVSASALEYPEMRRQNDSTIPAEFHEEEASALDFSDDKDQSDVPASAGPPSGGNDGKAPLRLDVAAARQLLGNLAMLPNVTEFRALVEAGLDPEWVAALEMIGSGNWAAEREVVDALLELLIEQVGANAVESIAIGSRWKPRRSVFSGRRARKLRQAIRERMFQGAP